MFYICAVAHKRFSTQLFVLWRVGLVVYRLFFHPLAKYPGPKLYAASNIPFQWKSNITGTLTLESKTLYDKYGPIVRVAPDHLSVDGSIAWPQIFQHRPGKTEWPKQRGFYHPGDESSLSQYKPYLPILALPCASEYSRVYRFETRGR